MTIITQLKGSDSLTKLCKITAFLIIFSIIAVMFCGCGIKAPDIDDTTREEISGISYAGDTSKDEKTNTNGYETVSENWNTESMTNSVSQTNKAETTEIAVNHNLPRLFVLSDKPDSNLVKTVNLAANLFSKAGKPSSGRMDIVYGNKKQIENGDIVISETSGLKEEEYHLEIQKNNTYK